MNTESIKIVDFQVVYKSIAGNSSRMEKHGLELLLQKLKEMKISIVSLTTNCHTQIQSFMKKKYASISHQFDIWHFA